MPRPLTSSQVALTVYLQYCQGHLSFFDNLCVQFVLSRTMFWLCICKMFHLCVGLHFTVCCIFRSQSLLASQYCFYISLHLGSSAGRSSKGLLGEWQVWTARPTFIGPIGQFCRWLRGKALALFLLLITIMQRLQHSIPFFIRDA